MPDAICFDITHNLIAPYFKNGDYASGLAAGIDAMMQAVRGEYKGAARPCERVETKSGKTGGPLIFLIIFVIIR